MGWAWARGQVPSGKVPGLCSSATLHSPRGPVPSLPWPSPMGTVGIVGTTVSLPGTPASVGGKHTTKV